LREISTRTDNESAAARTFRNELWDWTKSIAVALLVVLLIHRFGFQLSTVDGNSMLPTLHDGDRLFINKAIYLLMSPNYGDVVILQDPRRPAGKRVYLVKRVIGLPGDTIEIRDHRLYRNGEPVDEPYLSERMEMASYGPEVVPGGHYFVLGDNRNNSTDSRTFGSVSAGMIKGRAEWIVWPVRQWGHVT
jgi:signal peptidase I